MKKLNNNKGVAFVTVLISITFITILAVSLLYMAYLNYLTKSMRTRSNDNFYTGEFGVDEVAACLQQKAAGGSDIAGGKAEIKAAVGGSVDSGTGTYDPAKVTALINVSNSDGTSIVVTSSDPVYVANSNSVQLKNLRFDTTDANGFTSTIFTDMTVQFQTTPPGDFDINDFSVISDSIIAVNGSGQGSNNYAGCIYLRDSGDGYALKNDKKTLISLLCPVGILDGDLVIENGPSAVSIAGDVMVRGNVIVKDGCSLAVSGSLKISGELQDESGSHIVGDTHIKEHVDMSALPTEGLAGAVFAKHVYVFNIAPGGAGNYNEMIDLADISYGPLSKTVDANCRYKDDEGNTKIYPIVHATRQDGEQAKCETPVVSGFEPSKKYLAIMGNPSGKLNQSQIPGGGLVMSHYNIGYEGTFREVTMLTLGKMECYNDGEVSMTKMSKEGYQACKEVLYCEKKDSYSASSPVTSSAQYGAGNLNFQGGDFRDFCEAMCSGDWVVFSYDVDSGMMNNDPLIGVNTTETQKKNMEKTVYKTDSDGDFLDVDGNKWTPSSTKDRAIAISTDDATRYLVFQAGDGGSMNSTYIDKNKKVPGGTNMTVMIPYGYFLSSNTSNTVSKYVSSTSTAEDPEMTTVRYDNWYKE